jgi:hypothetical protein
VREPLQTRAVDSGRNFLHRFERLNVDNVDNGVCRRANAATDMEG